MSWSLQRNRPGAAAPPRCVWEPDCCGLAEISLAAVQLCQSTVQPSAAHPRAALSRSEGRDEPLQMSCSGCQTFKSLSSKKSPGTACPSSPHLSVTVPGMCNELCSTQGIAAGRALQEKCSGRRTAPLSCSSEASAPQHSTALSRGCSSACPTALLHLLLTAFLHPIPLLCSTC